MLNIHGRSGTALLSSSGIFTLSDEPGVLLISVSIKMNVVYIEIGKLNKNRTIKQL
jgi:hypothetical protein